MSSEIMNLFAFFQTFRLDKVFFCKDTGVFQLAFLPVAEHANERFAVWPRVFSDVESVGYFENTKQATFKVTGKPFAALVNDKWTAGEHNLNGLVMVAFPGNRNQFPSWASEKAGQVKLILKNGTDVSFSFVCTD